MKKRSVRGSVKDRHPEVVSNGSPGPGQKLVNLPVPSGLRPTIAGLAGGDDDHVHLLVDYPPNAAVSALLNSLKGVSIRLIRKKTIPVFRKNVGEGALWSTSDFSGSCGAAPIAVVRSISNSRKPRTEKPIPGRLRRPRHLYPD